MASIYKRPNGSFEIRFCIRPNVRRSFYPGKQATKRESESIGNKLDRLAFAAQQRETLPLEMAQWLSSLSDKQHAKLASWGLTEPRRKSGKAERNEKPKTLDQWLKRYLARGTWKPGTSGM